MAKTGTPKEQLMQNGKAGLKWYFAYGCAFFCPDIVTTQTSRCTGTWKSIISQLWFFMRSNNNHRRMVERVAGKEKLGARLPVVARGWSLDFEKISLVGFSLSHGQTLQH